MNLQNIHYYEITFGVDNENLGTTSICILGTRKPSHDEAENFCHDDMIHMEYTLVVDVTEISSEDAHKFFDMEKEETFPIFS